MHADQPHRRAKVLVVEDESLIALDLIQMVEELGHDGVGPAPTVNKALAIIEQERPDAAFLDENLHGKRITPVAERLVQQGVPFTVISGHFQDISGDEVLSRAHRLQKPVTQAQLKAAIDRMLET